MQESVMISVILPVYNVENYLRECLDSLINQDYQNFEVIAVNDGSTDHSLSILKEYESKFSNFILVNQENKGLSEARNAGIPYVTGKYIYFLDSDDFILPNTFSNLCQLAEENNLDLIKFDAAPFSEIPEKTNLTDFRSSDILKKDTLYTRETFAKSIIKKFMPPVWLYFIKSSIIKENNLTFKKGILHEDELFTIQLLEHCNRIMYDPNAYFQRRYRPNSIMTSSLNSNKKSFDSIIEIIKIFNDLQKSLDKNSDYYKLVENRKNALYTTLYFYKIDNKRPRIPKNLPAKLDFVTLMRQIKRVYFYKNI